MKETLHPIVLFDGVCNFCNSSVNFIIRKNKKRNLRFAALQSEYGKKMIEQFKIPITIDSIVYIEQNQKFIYSDAALRITKNLDFPFNFFYVFIIVPSFVRNRFYKWVAKNRYEWFGKKDACMIPSKEVKNLFFP